MTASSRPEVLAPGAIAATRLMPGPPPPAAIPLPDRDELPRHVAIIMDGNGRWARRRHLPRVAGHRAGVRAIRPVMEACDRAGVHILTLYAFSTENWQRPRAEVRALMRLFEETIDAEIGELHANGVQVRVLGRRAQLSPRLQQRIAQAEALTAANTGAVLNVAINYGGRSEIVDAVRSLAAHGHDVSQLDEATLGASLYTAGLPDPDLIIRTAGELRTSNFLLWQAAYAELHVAEAEWPDFGAAELAAALADYCSRERRFGAVPGERRQDGVRRRTRATTRSQPTASGPPAAAATPVPPGDDDPQAAGARGWAETAPGRSAAPAAPPG